jgi:hypothetical protein
VKTLQRIDVLSAAKMMAVVYACVGLLGGILFAFISLVMGVVGRGQMGGGFMFGAVFGVLAVILMPVFYGLMGFVGGALMAFVYNVLAPRIGGVRFELTDS